VLDGSGGARLLAGRDLSGVREGEALLITGAPDGSAWWTWLGEAARLSDADVELLRRDSTRPTIELIRNEALFAVLPSGSEPRRGADANGLLRVWVAPTRVVCLGEDAPAVDDAVRMLGQGRGPRDIAELLAVIGERGAARSRLAALALDDEVAEVEEAVAGGQASFDAALELRARLLSFRRRVASQRDLVETLLSLDAAWAVSPGSRRRWRELARSASENVDRTDGLLDRVHVIRDRIASRAADATNRVLYVVTLFTAVFAPLGFLTGLLGVNVGLGEGSLPGLSGPGAFWVIAGVLALLGLLQLALFRRLQPPP
jgi:zinc transporter